MKKVAILITILLLCLVISPTALALDVDIAVVGDDAEVDIEITGDNSAVIVNGKIPFETYVYTYEPPPYNDAWIQDWAVATEQDIEELCGILGITADGLAQVILLAQTNNQGIAEMLVSLVEQGNIIDGLIAEQVSATNDTDIALADIQHKITRTGDQLVIVRDGLLAAIAETDNKVSDNKVELSGVQSDLADTDGSIDALREELTSATQGAFDHISAEMNSSLNEQEAILSKDREVNLAFAEYLTGRVDDLARERVLQIRLLIGFAVATICALAISGNALKKSKQQR